MPPYSLSDYGDMISAQNDLRVTAFANALRRKVTSQSVVVDIGTGFGFFAMLAAKHGARHVYAIEPNDAVEFGPQLARENGVADKITFIQDYSTNVTLLQRADVIVSDLGGALPLFGPHIPSIIDARSRLLAPRGALIPSAASIHLAAVCVPQFYERITEVWQPGIHGLDLSSARLQALSRFRKIRLEADQVVTETACCAHLDYSAIDTPNLTVEVTMPVLRLGAAHGLALWSAYELEGDIGFSNAPGQPSTPIYAQSFLPWTEPVSLSLGDRVQVRLRARLRNDTYVWSWHTIVRDNQGATVAQFRQAIGPILRQPVAA